MHREANTMLSKTPGVESEALTITGSDLRSKRRLKNCASRYKTSNECGTRKQSDGSDRFRAIGLGEIDLGPAHFADAGDDGIEVMYYQAAPRD